MYVQSTYKTIEIYGYIDKKLLISIKPWRTYKLLYNHLITPTTYYYYLLNLKYESYNLLL